MTGAKLSHEISFGNILTVAVLAAGIIGGFVTTRLSTEQNATAIETLRTDFQAQIDLLRIEVKAVTTRAADDRETALQNQIELTRILTQLQGDVRYLRETLDRNEARQ